MLLYCSYTVFHSPTGASEVIMKIKQLSKPRLSFLSLNEILKIFMFNN